MKNLFALLLACGCSSTTGVAPGDTVTGGTSQVLTSAIATGGDAATGSASATGGALAATGGRSGVTGGMPATGGRSVSLATGGAAAADCDFAAPVLTCASGTGYRACRCSDFKGSAYCDHGTCVTCPEQAGLGVVYRDCDGDPSNGCETWTAGQECPR